MAKIGILICFHLFGYCLYVCWQWYVCVVYANTMLCAFLQIRNVYRRLYGPSCTQSREYIYNLLLVRLVTSPLRSAPVYLTKVDWTKFFVLFCVLFLFTFFLCFVSFFLFETIWFYMPKKGKRKKLNKFSEMCPNFPVVSWNIYVLYLLRQFVSIVEHNHQSTKSWWCKICCMHFQKTWWTSIFYVSMCMCQCVHTNIHLSYRCDCGCMFTIIPLCFAMFENGINISRYYVLFSIWCRL